MGKDARPKKKAKIEKPLVSDDDDVDEVADKGEKPKNIRKRIRTIVSSSDDEETVDKHKENSAPNMGIENASDKPVNDAKQDDSSGEGTSKQQVQSLSDILLLAPCDTCK